MTHTPGPWFYDIGTSSIGFSGGWIARVAREGEGLGEQIDDAHLIAASPELLDALMKLLEEPRNREYWLDAENAIAKAERGE